MARVEIDAMTSRYGVTDSAMNIRLAAINTARLLSVRNVADGSPTFALAYLLFLVLHCLAYVILLFIGKQT